MVFMNWFLIGTAAANVLVLVAGIGAWWNKLAVVVCVAALTLLPSRQLWR